MMMHPVPLLILLLVLWLPDLYIYFFYVRHRTRSRLLRALHFLPAVVLTLGVVLLMYYLNDNALAHHARYIGTLVIWLIADILPKLLFILVAWLSYPLRRLFGWRRRPFTWAASLLSLVSLAAVAYGAIIGVRHLRVVPLTYTHADIPRGFDGYRIVQLSDLHVGSWAGQPEFVEQLVTRVNDLHPDLILFTGDLVNQRSVELGEFSSILARLHAPDGVYSVLGNHDYGTYYRWPSPQAEQDNLAALLLAQANMHWTMLNNRHVIIRHRGDSIALIGVENDGEPPFSQHADLPRAADGTRGLFSILMTHNPTHWRREVIPDGHIQLTLSGHTHAMQVVLFGHSLSQLIYPEWRGLYTRGTQSLYVNIGIGYVGLPFRLGADPEITLITLKTPE